MRFFTSTYGSHLHEHEHTRIKAWCEIGVGQHVDLNVDVDVEVWSSLLAAMFILTLISVVTRLFFSFQKINYRLLLLRFLGCSRNVMPSVSCHRGSQRKHCTFHDVSLLLDDIIYRESFEHHLSIQFMKKTFTPLIFLLGPSRGAGANSRLGLKIDCAGPGVLISESGF